MIKNLFRNVVLFLIAGNLIIAWTAETLSLTLTNAWLEENRLTFELQADVPPGLALRPDDFRIQPSEQYYSFQSEMFNLQEKEVFGEIEKVIAGENNVIRIQLKTTDDFSFPLDIQIMYQLCEDDICHMPVSDTITVSQDNITLESLPVYNWQDQKGHGLENYIFTRSPVIVLFILLGLGLLSSLTPCIYPMIPITLGIIGVHGENSIPRNLIRSFIFVTGMTLSFSILGVLSAFTGFIIGQWMGNIWFLIFITVLFLAMALSLFNFFTIQFQVGNRFTRQFKGKWLSLILLGVISGFVVSPCIGPVVVGILSMIAHTGNPGLGLIYMGVYGYGLGLPLILLGTFAGTVTRIPRSGFWMEEVKKLLGVLLYLVPLFFWYYHLPQAIFFIITAFFLFPLPLLTGYLKDYFRKEHSRGNLIKGFISSLCILASLFFLFHGILLMHPAVYHSESQESLLETLNWHETLDNALPEAREREVLVLVNVTAPWCAACRVYKTYFQEPEIQELLKLYVLVELQLTDEIGEKYSILGIPQLLFFTPEGEELQDTRIIGLKSREEFKVILKDIINTYESQGLSGFEA